MKILSVIPWHLREQLDISPLEVNKSLTNFERTLERLRDPATLLDTIPEEKRAALIRLIFGGFTVSKDKSIAVSSNFSSGNLLAALRDIKTTTYNEKEAPERTSDSASSFMVDQMYRESNATATLLKLVEELGSIINGAA